MLNCFMLHYLLQLQYLICNYHYTNTIYIECSMHQAPIELFDFYNEISGRKQ